MPRRSRLRAWLAIASLAGLFVPARAYAQTPPSPALAPASGGPASPSPQPELAIEIDPVDYFPLLRVGASVELAFSERHAIKGSIYVLDDFYGLATYELEYRHFYGPRPFEGHFYGIAGFVRSASYTGETQSADGVHTTLPTTAWLIGAGVDFGHSWRFGNFFLSAGGGIEAFTLLGHPPKDENQGEHVLAMFYAGSMVLPRVAFTLGYVL